MSNDSLIEVGISANTAELDTGLNQAESTINNSVANIGANLQPIQFRFDMSGLQANIAHVSRSINTGVSNIRAPTVQIQLNSQEVQSQAQQAGDAIGDSLTAAREEASQTTEEVEQLGEAVAETGSEGEKAGGLLSEAFSTVKDYLAEITASVSVAGMLVLAKNTADAAKEIQNAARLANTSTDEMQRQAYAAKTVGMELDKLSDVYKDVNDKVGEYINNGGGELKDFFDTIAPKVGITAQQFQNLSGPQALQLYFTGLQKANLSQAQMTTYLEAIADDATSLMPLLRNNGEEFNRLGEHAQKLGIVLDQEALAKSNAFGTSVSTLQATISGFGSKLGSELAPSLTHMSDAITMNIENSESLNTVINTVVGGFDFMADHLETVIDLAGALAAAGLTRVIAGTTAAVYANIKATVQKVYADGEALVAAEAKAAAELQAARSLAAQTQATVLQAQQNERATRSTAQHAAALTVLADARIADRNATEAQTTAQNRYNAAVSAGRFSTTGLMGLLGGPAGLAVLVGSVAAGYLLMGDNADKSNKKLEGLTGTIKEQVKQLKEMDAVQRNIAIREATKQQQTGLDIMKGVSVLAQKQFGFTKFNPQERGLSLYSSDSATYQQAGQLSKQYAEGKINFDQYYLAMSNLDKLTVKARDNLDLLAKTYKEGQDLRRKGNLTVNAATQVTNPAYAKDDDSGGNGAGQLDWQVKAEQERQGKIKGILDGSVKADPEVWKELQQAFVAESNKQLDELRKVNASQTQIEQYQANRAKEGDKLLEDFVVKIANTYNGLTDKIGSFEKKAANPGTTTKDELDKEYEGLKESVGKFKALLAKNDNFSINHTDESGKNTAFKGKSVIGDLQGRIDTAYQAESKQIQLKSESEITLFKKQEELKRNLVAIDMAEQRTKHEYDLGLLTNRDLLEAAKDYERQRFELKKKALEDQLELQKQMDAAAGTTTETKEQRQISTQIVDLSDQNALSMQGLNLQSEADKIETTFGGLSERMSSLWDQGLQSMMDGTLTWRNASNAIISSMTQFFIQKMVQEPLFAMMTGMARRLLIKIGFIKSETAAEATGQALQTGAHTAGEATRTGVTAAGGLARLALKAGEAIKSILMYAWEAMAGAYNALVSIPYVGPFIAPAAGIAAFALVAGIAGKIKSARGGYDVPAGLNPITQIHEEEMVLPKPYANVIREMAKGGEAGQQADGVNPAPVAAAGGDSYHFNIQALDAKSIKRLFIDNRGAVAEAAKVYSREFKKPGR